MMWLIFCIILICCSMVKSGQKDCLVYNVDQEFRKQHWSGDEVTFYAFIMEDNVLNIEMNYDGLDKTEYFTTLYFSPSKKYSKRIETKDGNDIHYNLTPMPKANNWIQFNISSQHRMINVFYEPHMHEIIPINQSAHAFSDLIIKASNRSSCKDERKWILHAGNPETIPLGEDTAHHNFYLKINPTDDFIIDIKIDNYTEQLLQSDSEYSLHIENTKVTLQPLSKQRKDTPYTISQNVTSLEISSKVGKVTLSVYFQTSPPPVPYEVYCPPNQSTFIISLVVIFTICTIFFGLGFKCKLRSRIREMVWSSECKGNNAQTKEERMKIELFEQGDLLNNTENNSRNEDQIIEESTNIFLT